MIAQDKNLLFFGNYVDSSEKIDKLRAFLDHVDGFLSGEARFYEEEAHVDLEIEFLPLFSEAFPPILYSSLVITTVVILEQEIRGYATALLDSIGGGLKFSDFSGTVLERFKVVVTKIVPVDFCPVRARWDDIVGLFEVRNCLVHSAGELASFRNVSTVKAFLKRHKELECSDGRLVLNASTSKLSVSIADEFLHEIYRLALRKFPGRYGGPD